MRSRVKPRFVFACDRCTRFIVADHFAPLCRHCAASAGDWPRPINAREIAAAATRARKLSPVHRPATRTRSNITTTRKEEKA